MNVLRVPAKANLAGPMAPKPARVLTLVLGENGLLVKGIAPRRTMDKPLIQSLAPMER